MRSMLLRIGVVTVILGLALTAEAATDGTLGTSSTGTSIVTLTTGDAYQVTQLSDIAIGPLPYPTLVDATGTDDVCVFANNALGQYHVTLSSANGGGAGFTLTNGADNIPYSAGWTGLPGSTFAANTCTAVPGTGCTDGVISSAVQTGASSVLNCGGFQNATLSVAITVANMNAAPMGAYSDTITVLIAP